MFPQGYSQISDSKSQTPKLLTPPITKLITNSKIKKGTNQSHIFLFRSKSSQSLILFQIFFLTNSMMLQLYCYDSLKCFPLLHACHFISQELQRGFFLLASIPFLHLIYIYIFFFFLQKEFQPMTSAPNDSSLLSNQDINRFLVQLRIEPQISYSTIRNFTN